MKCEVCNSTIIVTDKQCENCGTNIFDIGIKWQARAEKAESELKAIKDRINGIAEIPTIENGVFVKDCRWNAGYNTGVSDCKEIIKQIGGGK